MEATFGQVEFTNGAGALKNRIRLADGPLDLAWQHCGVTSEFLGDFFALKRAGDGADYNEARHSIGYLTNELLENALKFRHRDGITLDASLDGDCFEIRISNLITQETASKFQTLLAELTTRDPGELLIERIEENAENMHSSGSGLGLLTLMNDYGARLGWRFQPATGTDAMRLDTFAALDIV
ncbi:slr1658 superfamily regulator [Shinella sp.]|uniref:slr1658 superfamily regulator n=2 Tax=Shinella sp. TaxID=1870904 RepID=UPI004035A72B